VTTDQFTLGAGNQDQFRAWNGDEGHQWAANAAYYDTAVRQHHQRLMQAAAIGPDDRVLDVGCGTGQCTHDAARRAVRGAALGIDLSLPMIRMATATARGEGLPNASFVRGDAQVHPFPPRTFDIAVSRFGSMFFSDQVGALTNIGRALRPHGRLLLVSWRSARENDWISVLREALLPGAPAPEATTNTPTATTPWRSSPHQAMPPSVCSPWTSRCTSGATPTTPSRSWARCSPGWCTTSTRPRRAGRSTGCARCCVPIRRPTGWPWDQRRG